MPIEQGTGETPTVETPSRAGTSPIGTSSANSGATAATDSTYGVGAYTSGISEEGAATTRTLQNTDYEGIVIFDTGAPVLVTLNSNVTPNFQATILNLDSGAISFITSDSSAINGGPDTLTLGANQGADVFFADRQWWVYAGVTAVETVPIATDSSLGIVQPDGVTIGITAPGVIYTQVTADSGAPSSVPDTPGNPFYFDNSVTPWQGYCWFAGSWHKFG